MIVGDININSNPVSPDSANYVNLLSSYDVSVSNTHMTRNSSGRIIDHFASNLKDDTSIRNFTVTTSLSDHNFVLTQLLCIKSAGFSKVIEINRTNYERMKEVFEQSTDFRLIFSKKDPDEITEMLTESINFAVKKASTTMKVKVKNGMKVRTRNRQRGNQGNHSLLEKFSRSRLRWNQGIAFKESFRIGNTAVDSFSQRCVFDEQVPELFEACLGSIETNRMISTT